MSEQPLLLDAVIDGKIVNKFNPMVYLKDHYGLLFFYPLNFTFVCPTEIKALNEAIEDLAAKDVRVLMISKDSVHSHLAWQNGEIGKIKCPHVSDFQGKMTDMLGAGHPKGMPKRATFLLDKNLQVKVSMIYDLDIGRSVSEILRATDAMIFAEKHGELCPVNWKQGDKGIKV